MMQTRSAPALALLLATAAALSACVAPEPREEVEPAKEIVFPPPPDPARFVFEGSLFSSAQLLEDTATLRLRRLVTGEQVAGRGFGKPFDVAACKGRIYVSDSVERVVMVFDVPGKRFFEIGTRDPGLLSQPLGINTDPQCNVFVADSTLKKIMMYAPDGKFVREMGGPDMFDRLSHVAVSPDGARVYAVDTGGVDSQNHRVRVFEAATGRHLHDVGSRGKDPGQFNLPRDIEIGRDGLIYVVDGANFRVQVVRDDGTMVRAFGTVGRQTGQFARPKGIALDPQGRIYVSDAAFGNYQIFTPEGQLLLFVGTRGSRPTPATYMLPAGIDVDEDGRVYMVDQFFRKVDIYRPVELARDAGYLGVWFKPTAN